MNKQINKLHSLKIFYESARQMSSKEVEENDTVPVNKLNNSECIRKVWRNAVKCGWGCRNEDGCIVGCCTVHSGRYLPTFLCNIREDKHLHTSRRQNLKSQKESKR
jgi:hypothetical protein